MNTVQVPLPRLLIVQTDKASGEQVASMMGRYGYSIVGPFEGWAETGLFSNPDAIEAAVVDWASGDEAAHAAARRLMGLDIPLVLYAAPSGFNARPADLRHVPFFAKLTRTRGAPVRRRTCLEVLGSTITPLSRSSQGQSG